MILETKIIMIQTLSGFSAVSTAATSPELTTTVDENILGLLPAIPPAWLLYLTILLTFMHFLWRLITFVIARIDRRSDRASRIKQDYWLDKLLIPVCIEPLIEFCIKNSHELENIELLQQTEREEFMIDLAKEYLSSFQEDKQKLASRFSVLGNINKSAYDSVLRILDELEDDVSVYCAKISLGESFSGLRENVSSNPSQTVMYTLTRIFSQVFPPKQFIV